jgi:transcriptional regulator with XRE-family HTH domain
MNIAVLGERLCRQRLARKWSQATLAYESGVMRARISDLERGKRQRPSAETLAKLARALGVSVDWLIGKEG